MKAVLLSAKGESHVSQGWAEASLHVVTTQFGF